MFRSEKQMPLTIQERKLTANLFPPQSVLNRATKRETTMSTTTGLSRKTDEQPLPPTIAGSWTEPGRPRRRTREVVIDHERVRRFTTLEVRWDGGIERLTIDDVHLDECLDVAARIMEVLPFDRIELEEEDDETLRYTVFDPSWTLTSVVFLKKSLRRLASDPHRSIKIEYLRRDLLWSTTGRRSFVYPSALRAALIR